MIPVGIGARQVAIKASQLASQCQWQAGGKLFKFSFHLLRLNVSQVFADMLKVKTFYHKAKIEEGEILENKQYPEGSFNNPISFPDSAREVELLLTWIYHGTAM
jgi:hypothetical protein